MNELRRVEVAWLDSVSEGRWNGREQIEREATREAMLHRSIGYLLLDTEDFVLLAGSRSESSDMYADTMQIPRVAVLSTTDLVEPNNDDTYDLETDTYDLDRVSLP